MLLNLLPGIREMRAPLAAGYLWLAAAWLTLAPFPPRAEADGPLAVLYDLGDAATSIGIAVAVSFFAYLVGSFSHGVFEGLLLSRIEVSPRGRKTLLLLITEQLTGLTNRLTAVGAEPHRILRRFRTLSDEWEDIQASERYFPDFAFERPPMAVDGNSRWTVTGSWGSLTSDYLAGRLQDLERDVRALALDPQEEIQRLEERHGRVRDEVEELTQGTHTLVFPGVGPPVLTRVSDDPAAELGFRWESAGPPNFNLRPAGVRRTDSEQGTKPTEVEDGQQPDEPKAILTRLRDKLYDQIVSDELDVIKARLIIEAPNLHSVVDRYHAEASLRIAILPPAVFVTVVICATIRPLWLAVGIFIVSATILMALLRQARVNHRKGNDLLVDSLRLDPTRSHTLMALQAIEAKSDTGAARD